MRFTAAVFPILVLIATATSGAETKKIEWLLDLKASQQRAANEGKAVFIFVGVKGSASCRKMAAEIETPAMEQELAGCVCVFLNPDTQPKEAEELGVTSVPALRIRTPGGETTGTQDGYLSPDDLLKWLKKYRDEALASADAALADSAEPDAAAVARLVQLFNERSPAVREAAISRLSAYPQAARPAVVKAFREGNLSSRLAALEVLRQWKAPVEEMDPWHPETLSEERFRRLDKWLNENGDQKQIAAPKELSPEERSAARQDIARMLKADDAESAAICHRLARFGPALLPEVYALLKDVSGDQDRQRLLVLRYRLAATDSLALRWPGGLVRLAGSDLRQRQRAAEELVNLASAAEEPLLTELFSDPDPLVREISLRGLQHIGGKEANAAIVRLLADPEPNVRAAVLKQLEEAPDADMLPAIEQYLKTEKDPDLIVHGIRFLQESKRPEAMKSLMSLLSHESWQVRSEAASGIGKLMENGNFDNAAEQSENDSKVKSRADVYAALINLLDDPDAFVGAKAVEGLAHANMALAVEPLIKAAQKHPQLAPEIFTTLVSNSNMMQPAIPHIRKFCKHSDADVRAAAIGALCQAISYDVEDEILSALGDKESKVRIAAASGMFKTLEQQRSGAWQQVHQGNLRNNNLTVAPVYTPPPSVNQSILSTAAEIFFGVKVIKNPPPPTVINTRQVPMTVEISETPTEISNGETVEPAESAKPEPDGKGDSSDAASKTEKRKPDESKSAVKKDEGKADESKNAETEPNPWDKWLENYYAGQNRPKWTATTIGPLEKMLSADSVKEKLAAAVALVPLGKSDEALPVINDAVRSNPEYLDMAREVLPWLTWERRLEVFRRLDASVKNEETSLQLIRTMGEAADRRTAELFWELLAGEKITREKAAALVEGLRQAYLGNRFYSASNIPASDRRELIREAKPRTASGSELQRLAALVLLANVSDEEAAEAAGQMADDTQLSETMRLDAFQVHLCVQPKKDAVQTAIAAMETKKAGRKKIALKYLVHGPTALRSLNNGLFLYGSFDSSNVVVYGSDKLIVPKPPEGLEAGQIRPLLADSDPEIAASAGYLLALMDQPDGMDALLKYWNWKGQPKKYNPWSRLVYRAIAVSDDPKYLPVLKEIYANLEQYEVREFYWTIRSMTGPEILKFRKQIRDERGASELQ
ncbi:MAG: HEAT repeat domain-containing protein [Thermoguttaceae bacterium]|jgi:HEAT repeat protein